MHFSTDRCVQCRTPIHRQRTTDSWNLIEGGGYPPVSHWFCHDSCYREAIAELIPAHFQGRAEDSAVAKKFVQENEYHHDGQYVQQQYLDLLRQWRNDQ